MNRKFFNQKWSFFTRQRPFWAVNGHFDQKTVIFDQKSALIEPKIRFEMKKILRQKFWKVIKSRKCFTFQQVLNLNDIQKWFRVYGKRLRLSQIPRFKTNHPVSYIWPSKDMKHIIWVDCCSEDWCTMLEHCKNLTVTIRFSTTKRWNDSIQIFRNPKSISGNGPEMH